MRIRIRTPSRLHFGLIDLNGELGRINGSIGIALNNPFWEIEGFDYNIANNLSVIEEPTQKAIEQFDNYFHTKTNEFSINITHSLPSHVGLGSNTQFILAIGSILAKIHQINSSPRELAKVLHRGGTSGIGVASFEAGGFIVDGGHSFGSGKQAKNFQPSSTSRAPPPPVLFRFYPPENWHFIIITPQKIKGMFGKKEVSLFQRNCPIPARDVERLSRLILMKILPAILEGDISTFGHGLTDIHSKFDRFGLEKYTEGIASEILDYLTKSNEIYGSGISSFGPTIYGLTDNEFKAKKLINNFKEIFSEDKFSLITYSQVNTSGANISVIDE